MNLNWKIPMTLLTLVLASIFIAGCSSTTTSTGDTQVFKLSVNSKYLYEPQQIKVKLGTKVRIEGDPNTVKGTMDTIVIDGYNVRKKVTSGDNILEFVADKKGEFAIHCENGMGDGKLIVE